MSMYCNRQRESERPVAYVKRITILFSKEQDSKYFKQMSCVGCFSLYLCCETYFKQMSCIGCFSLYLCSEYFPLYFCHIFIRSATDMGRLGCSCPSSALFICPGPFAVGDGAVTSTARELQEVR